MKPIFYNLPGFRLKSIYRLIISSLCIILIVLPGCRTGSDENGGDGTIWEKPGPGGGEATFIPAFSWHTPDNFLVRCDMTGSYLKTDGGNSYSQINFAGGASSYAFDPLDFNKVYNKRL